jgi:hypothetical protein
MQPGWQPNSEGDLILLNSGYFSYKDISNNNHRLVSNLQQYLLYKLRSESRRDSYQLRLDPVKSGQNPRKVRGRIQKFPDWPAGAWTANGTAHCHWVQLYRHFMSQSSEFCRHKPLWCLPTSVYCCCCLFRYDSVRKLLDITWYTTLDIGQPVSTMLTHVNSMPVDTSYTWNSICHCNSTCCSKWKYGCYSTLYYHLFKQLF